MRHLILIASLWAATLAAAPKTVAYLRVTKVTPIYHGADLNSKVEAEASKGEVYELVSTGLIHGFYKIDLGGHVSYIHSGAVVLLNASGSPVPTPAATPAPKGKATPRPSPTPGEDGEEAQATPKATLKASPASVTEAGVDEAPAPTPTARPTRVPTLAPTELPTEEPTLLPTEAPTLETTPQDLPPRPHSMRTGVPRRHDLTPAPTQLMAEATTPPTAAPTPVPTLAPTPRPFAPTPLPTLRPTAAPTLAPEPTAVPGLVTPERARAKRRVQRNTVQTQRGGGQSGIRVGTLAVGGAVASRVRVRREAGHLDRVEFYLPLGLGKHETLVQPPYKQHAGVNDQRPVEYAGFAGLGLELRLARPLRLGFDWTAHSHRTKAADLGLNALKVGVPGAPATTLFDESAAWYRMNTHQLRMNLKLSLPHPVVEPWVSGSYGAWIWTAELSDIHREIIYGEETGLAFGGTVGTGIDFHGSFGGGLGWTITPFVEWGAPQVNPKFKDIAGLGVDWQDSFGTPVAVPARAGLQFGIGF